MLSPGGHRVGVQLAEAVLLATAINLGGQANLMRQQIRELTTIAALIALVFTLALLTLSTLIFVVVVVPGGRL